MLYDQSVLIQYRLLVVLECLSNPRSLVTGLQTMQLIQAWPRRGDIDVYLGEIHKFHIPSNSIAFILYGTV